MNRLHGGLNSLFALRGKPLLQRSLRPHRHVEAFGKATALADLLARETFYRELPSIEQHARGIDAEYERRYDEALEFRVAAYTKALDHLVKTPGWTDIDEDQQRKLASSRGNLRPSRSY